MRIARVLPVSRAGEEGGKGPPRPIVALERDGALYDVAALDRLHGTTFSPERFEGASDFHTRVVALGCAGLAELDEALLSGSRPSDARLLPGSFLWLPPCDPDRAAYLQLGGDARDAALAEEVEPPYWLGNPRGFLGHEARVPFPWGEDEPDYELGVAAILAEDVRGARPDEADAALLGYAILNDWTGRTLEARARAAGAPTTPARDFATQLGPVLVTKDEVGDVSALRTRARVDGEVHDGSRAGASPWSLAEAIAYLSHHVELRAGDVIGAGCVLRGSATAAGRTLRHGERVELSVERLGMLAGVPVVGPGPARWRR
jgi:2-keto-4-pentenoate hydratase/2-oxohepta-3-ene-1,7-dioic acid hydratase in catechol pathway